MMHGREKSDLAIVAAKLANKAERSAAEPVERRAGTKGNAGQQSTSRTQSREGVTQALERITESRKGKEEGEAHCALPPHQHRALEGSVLRTFAERSPWGGSADVEGLRGRPRTQYRGLA